MLALQRSVNGFDGQFPISPAITVCTSCRIRSATCCSTASPRTSAGTSYTNGVQGDASYLINPAHTVAHGLHRQRRTDLGRQYISWSRPTLPVGNTPNRSPTMSAKLGWLAGVYAQDEWRITDKLTMNAGLRFDQMWQYVDANQFGPRVSFTYKPFEYTTLHAGYARYFTPPVLVEAAPANIASVQRHQRRAGRVAGRTRCCRNARIISTPASIKKFRSDAATTAAKDCTTLDLGIDAYYKIATDLIDNGNFGQALVLSAFNYAKGVTEGVEFCAKFHRGNFQAYGNLAVGQEKATQVVSNQYLFDNATPLPISVD